MALANFIDVDFSSITSALNQIVNYVNAASLTKLTGAGAVPPHATSKNIITNTAATALTLAAPTAGTDDGLSISIQSATAFAHTLTATGLLATGSASVNVATFAAFAGASIELVAYNGKWLVKNSNAITFS